MPMRHEKGICTEFRSILLCCQCLKFCRVEGYLERLGLVRHSEMRIGTEFQIFIFFKFPIFSNSTSTAIFQAFLVFNKPLSISHVATPLSTNYFVFNVIHDSRCYLFTCHKIVITYSHELILASTQTIRSKIFRTLVCFDCPS